MISCCSLQSLQFCSFEDWKGEIPAGLQELQTANGGIHLQKHITDNIMNEYRFHLQKYKPGSKTVCPGCGRKSCFTRYIDEVGEISFPGYVGKCDHINSCGYHYSPKEYFRDNPSARETSAGHKMNGSAFAIKYVAKQSPTEQEPEISYLSLIHISEPTRPY